VLKEQATQPALPPTQAANERAPSERSSEAERQRSRTAHSPAKQPAPAGGTLEH